jgi:hypothetical protein
MKGAAVSLIASVRKLVKSLRKFTASSGEPPVLPVWQYPFCAERSPPRTAKSMMTRQLDALRWLAQRISQAKATGISRLGETRRAGRIISVDFELRQHATETMRVIFDQNTIEIENRLDALLLSPLPAAVKDLLRAHHPLRTITGRLRQVRELVDHTDSPLLKSALGQLLNMPLLDAIIYRGQIARDESVWTMTIGLRFSQTPRDVLQALVAAASTMKNEETEWNSPIRLEGMQVFVKNKPVPLELTSDRTKDALVFIGELNKEPGNWKSSSEIGKATKSEGVRFDRIYKDLPVAVKSQIESRTGKGFRVRLA